jgi:hypothetical protein
MHRTPLLAEKGWTVLKVTKLRKQIQHNTPLSLMSYFLGMPESAIRYKAAAENLSLLIIDDIEK